MAAENSARHGCVERNEIHPGMKSFHLEHVKRRRRSASHVLYFKEAPAANGAIDLVVIGLLHESMEPKRKLGQALRSLDREAKPKEGTK